MPTYTVKLKTEIEVEFIDARNEPEAEEIAWQALADAGFAVGDGETLEVRQIEE